MAMLRDQIRTSLMAELRDQFRTSLMAVLRPDHLVAVAFVQKCFKWTELV